jgi:RNA polymerase sigma-70 factor (ECF subfamily)
LDRDLDQVLDEYLVLLARDGSRPALAQLVGRWSPRIVRHVARTLGDRDAAADVTQETWLAALGALGRLDDPARFPAWLYAIATRKCVDLIRSRARAQRLGAGLAAQAAPSPGAQSDDGLDLTAALARLPADQRLVASLFYGEDLDLETIAAIAGVPVGTVKSRLHHARAALRTHLEGGQT